MLDTGISYDFSKCYGMLLKDKNDYLLMEFDALGSVTDINPFIPKENTSETGKIFNFEDFNDKNILFLNLKKYDEFREMNYLFLYEDEKPIIDILKSSNKSFFKNLYQELIVKFEERKDKLLN